MNRFVAAFRPSLSPAKRGIIVLLLLLAGMAGAISQPAAASGPAAPPRQAVPAVGSHTQYVHVHPLLNLFECGSDLYEWVESGTLNYAADLICPNPTSARITWQVQVYDAYDESWDYYDSDGPDSCANAQDWCYSPPDVPDGDYYSTYVGDGEQYRVITFYYLCAEYCDGNYDIEYFNT